MDIHMLRIAADIAEKHVVIEAPNFGSQRGLRGKHHQSMAEDGPEDGVLHLAPQSSALRRSCIYNKGLSFQSTLCEILLPHIGPVNVVR